MKTVLAMIVLGLSLSVMGAKEAFEKTKAKAEKPPSGGGGGD